MPQIIGGMKFESAQEVAKRDYDERLAKLRLQTERLQPRTLRGDTLLDKYVEALCDVRDCSGSGGEEEEAFYQRQAKMFKDEILRRLQHGSTGLFDQLLDKAVKGYKR